MNTELLDSLTRFSSPNVFNPWSSRDEKDCTGLGADGRKRRLLQHFDCNPIMILVGEAPGYQGCRFSGVPYTSERLILSGRIPRITESGRLTTRKLSFSEPSATVVWGMLDDLGIGDRVVMWNAFAWHPHEPGNPYSNRAPSRAELAAGLPILCGVMAHFAGVPVVPVGRKAEETLMALEVKAMPWVRHPSRSGAALFREELRARFVS
jgi:hypothetical protein